MFRTYRTAPLGSRTLARGPARVASQGTPWFIAYSGVMFMQWYTKNTVGLDIALQFNLAK